jgi:tetratricopeptide (TPR) repeat protein
LDGVEGVARERAHTLLGMGLVQEMLNHFEVAADYYQQALAAYQLAGDQENEALTLHNLGQLADNQGAVMAALGYYFQALSLNLVANRGNNLLGIAEDLSALAALIWAVQDIVDQEMPAEQPMRLEDVLAGYVRSLKQDLAASDVIGVEGRHWVAEWNLDDSRMLVRQMQERALKLHEAIGNRRGQIWTLTDLAIWQRDAGEYDAAEEYLQEALVLAEGVAAPRELYETYLNLGDVRLMAEEPHGAIVAYESAVAAAESLRARLLVEVEALSYFNELNLIAYERLIRLNAQLNPRQALEWLERAKAREFLRRLRWGAMGRSPQVSAELWQREAEGVAQFRAAAEALAGAAESDRLIGVDDYRRAEEFVLAV